MEHLLTYILMAVLMSMLPGTDTVLIMRNYFAYGAKGAYYTVIGIATGLLFWTCIAVLGLSVAISQSVFVFNLIRYVGAAYLLYIGIRVLLTRSHLQIQSLQPTDSSVMMHQPTKHYKESLLQGMISNILNPKTVLVYVTFIPQFIDTEGHVHQQLLYLGLILTLIAVIWFIILVGLLQHLQHVLQKPKVQLVFQKLTGLALIGFGVKTAL